MPIQRHEPSAILSQVVEANGFVFTAGVVAKDPSRDARGQTEQILSEIDRLLALCGTDKSKVVSTTIWVSDIRHRDAMNEAWTAWTGGKNLPGSPRGREDPAGFPRSFKDSDHEQPP
jgi:enamine deaminase RidA (YjgF/YER057c/UK114 family)